MLTHELSVCLGVVASVLVLFTTRTHAQTTAGSSATNPPPVAPAYLNTQTGQVRHQQCGIPNGDASILTNLESRKATTRLRKSDRIVGGTSLSDGSGSLCWQVAVLQSDNSYTNYVGWSGSIIGQKTILTTAHNVLRLYFQATNATTPANFQCSNYPSTVTIGVISQNSGNLAGNPYPSVVSGCSKQYKVVSAIVHPNYDDNTGDNDIAILVLNDTIDFRASSRCACPICLSEKTPAVGDTCVLSGWGQTTDPLGSVPSPRVTSLSYVPQSVVTPSMCLNTSYPNPNSNPDLFVCSGGVVGQDGCYGDGGGPLVCYDSAAQAQYLAGINSFREGSGCGEGFPAASTKVAAYLSWIFNTAPLGDVSIMLNNGAASYG